uniref:Bcl-2-like protein 1 n=1 Tax=Dermatophagoides pteronyssinus TaxID=6956 RepID=A0A6P6XWD0_DERPT|nr:bcl-2-like protein 1 [Dermatophagoides pteronyssinus]
MSLQNADALSSSTSTNMNSTDHHIPHSHVIHNGTNPNQSTDEMPIYDPMLMNLVKDFFNAQFELKKAQCPFPSSSPSTSSSSSSSSSNPTATTNNTQSLVNHSQIRMALRALGKSFEEKYARQLYEIIVKLELQPQNACATFHCLSNEMFVQGIQWNHIVTYFVFSVDFAYYASQQHVATVNDVAKWLTRYTAEHLLPWIEKNGGWDDIVKFAQDIIGDVPNNDNALFNMDLKNILCGAAGALGVLSLGLFLSSK